MSYTGGNNVVGAGDGEIWKTMKHLSMIQANTLGERKMKLKNLIVSDSYGIHPIGCFQNFSFLLTFSKYGTRISIGRFTKNEKGFYTSNFPKVAISLDELGDIIKLSDVIVSTSKKLEKEFWLKQEDNKMEFASKNKKSKKRCSKPVERGQLI